MARPGRLIGILHTVQFPVKAFKSGLPALPAGVSVTDRRHPHNRLKDLAIRQALPGRYADGNCLYLYVRESGSRSWIQRLVIQGFRAKEGLRRRPRRAARIRWRSCLRGSAGEISGTSRGESARRQHP